MNDKQVATIPKSNNVGTSVVAVIPQDMDTMYRVATAFYEGGFCPPDCGDSKKAFIRIFAGAELGLGPLASIQNISVVNNRPAVWGDAMLGIVEASGMMEDISETYEGEYGTDDYKAVVVVKRKNRPTPITKTFSVADAKTAKLWGKAGSWTTNPYIMLMNRARAFALRAAFSDKLKGIRSVEEARDEDAIDVTPAGNYASAEEVNRQFMAPKPVIHDVPETAKRTRKKKGEDSEPLPEVEMEAAKKQDEPEKVETVSKMETVEGGSTDENAAKAKQANVAGSREEGWTEDQMNVFNQMGGQ